MNRSRMAFALGLVVPTLSLAGCSDDPVPKVAPHESPSVVSESPSPTGPTEPTMPAVAKKHTAAGAEAFVKFYWEMVNYAQASGDLQGLRSLGDENCGACSGGLRFLDRIYEAGGHVRGGKVTVVDVRATKVRGAGQQIAFQVLVSVENTRQVVDLPGTKRDQSYPAAKSSIQFIVDPKPGSWSVGYWDEAKA